MYLLSTMHVFSCSLQRVLWEIELQISFFNVHYLSTVTALIVNVKWCMLNLNKACFSLNRTIMQDVSNDNRVLSLVAQSGIRNTLVTLLDQLQRCQKSLNEFLEVCRFLRPCRCSMSHIALLLPYFLAHFQQITNKTVVVISGSMFQTTNIGAHTF